ncbi:aldehyde oxidoreductase molybdenum-binding subunit PaoC [Alloyangia pacifica]|uniref:Xanthine dehydrogenase YagR molybdenum-binding subunit n=1 Tax=Alloyangia pacifica TaxID=311180 RepID=A0A1I6VV25_9RHOB|nr:aldehyde oxidoreductase molybdenum-binding subunit PaoC [Alloyangia pacifica]SDI24704.1 xanthine dehydrogenase YagR molybdenum-binding subunit [Alloyangia pacifica]SFT17558.1 xanthine dehydrogenase YagR molybdenum-binding subunit [Alloyangia pacifica]
MQFNQPAGDNLFDNARLIGRPTPRIDGPLKVSGQAPYAYERHDAAEGQLVGYPVVSTIAQGRITGMDTSAAEAAPGVIGVVTTLEVGEMPTPSGMHTAPLFGGAEVWHYHQAIAVVVAESFEQARAAAALVKVDYDVTKGSFDLEAVWQQKKDDNSEPVARVGDFETAYQAAEVTLDQEYRTPSHSHAMMEPHASIAEWQDGKLTVWTSNQMIEWGRQSLATTLEMDADDIRVDSPYIGGGFGAKLFLRADAVMAALAARKLQRAVKVMLPRPMVMNNTTHRASTIQRIRIGAQADGKITAIAHEAISHTLPGGSGEDAVDQTRKFYAGDNRLIVKHLAEMHLPEANAMRAPGEASGLMALEIAMDEMAEKLGMDPVEFRTVNDTQVDPENPDRTFSDRHFVECLRQGAEAFGWVSRNTTPGGMRDGQWLIGHGVAGAYRGGPATTSGARVRLQDTGRIIVETDMTDIGTGSYTILAQTVAETMGVDLDAVEVRLGDSDFPVSAGSGGQWGAASSTAGAYAACIALREQIAERLRVNDPETLSFANGAVNAGEKQVTLASLAADGELVAEDSISFGDFRDEQVVSTFAAHFVELGVHVGTGEIRLRRMLAACDAGRILNPVTARSQVIGGMVMGVGAAMMEEMAIDTGRGYFPAHDLAGYEVPVHMDIPSQEVIFLDTVDPASSPLKAKGVGELGLCGVAAAVANAVYNATGVRVRSYPMTLDKYLDQLPAV